MPELYHLFSVSVPEEISLRMQKLPPFFDHLTLPKLLDQIRILARLPGETAEQIASSLSLLFNKTLEVGVYPVQ